MTLLILGLGALIGLSAAAFLLACAFDRLRWALLSAAVCIAAALVFWQVLP